MIEGPFATRSEHEHLQAELADLAALTASALKSLETIAMKQQKDIELLEGMVEAHHGKLSFMETDLDS